MCLKGEAVVSNVRYNNLRGAACNVAPSDVGHTCPRDRAYIHNPLRVRLQVKIVVQPQQQMVAVNEVANLLGPIVQRALRDEVGVGIHVHF